MPDRPAIRTIFLDIGGVILTNGWDRRSRRRAAEVFNLDREEMDERHSLTFDTYEQGKLSLEAYLERVVFYRPRNFTPGDFTAFMFEQSQPYPEMINLITALRERHRLKIAVLSNEGRELTNYRISRFRLTDFVDFFIVSSFVHIRKPDSDIYRLALDVAQTSAEQVAYIDDRPMFVEVARSEGIRGIYHQSFEKTRDFLAELGLTL